MDSEAISDQKSSSKVATFSSFRFLGRRRMHAPASTTRPATWSNKHVQPQVADAIVARPVTAVAVTVARPTTAVEAAVAVTVAHLTTGGAMPCVHTCV